MGGRSFELFVCAQSLPASWLGTRWLRRGRGRRLAPVLPEALLLERLGDLGRHVVLVVLGEHAVGTENPTRFEFALGHHALALAEEVREDAAIAHRNLLGRIGNGELDIRALAALDTTHRDEAAETDPLALGDGI